MKSIWQKVFSKEKYQLSFNQQFLKVPKLFFGYIWKNPKVYLLNFFFPPILIYVIMFFWSSSMEYVFYPPMFFNVLLISVLLNMVFLSFMMLDWKHSILLNRIKLNGFSKSEILLGIYLVFFVVMLASFLFSLIIFTIFWALPWGNPFLSGVQNYLNFTFSNLTFYNASLSALILILFIFFSISLAILIPMLVEKKGLAKTIMILMFLFAGSFAEIFFNSQFSSRIYWWNYLGYLSPWKYFSWYGLYINSYAIINPRGMDQVIDIIGKPYLSFSSVIVPSIISSILSIGFPILSFKFFKLGTK